MTSSALTSPTTRDFNSREDGPSPKKRARGRPLKDAGQSSVPEVCISSFAASVCYPNSILLKHENKTLLQFTFPALARTAVGTLSSRLDTIGGFFNKFPDPI